MGGMPSRGGPPEMISAGDTERFEKSVFQPEVETRKSAGCVGAGAGFDGAAVAVEIVAGLAVSDVPAAIGTSVWGGDVLAGRVGDGRGVGRLQAARSSTNTARRVPRHGPSQP